MFHKRSKRVDIRFHFTGELVESKEIIISYLQTDSMLADIFTKSLARCKHGHCVRMLKMC
jgi:hypothetical protein